MSTADFANLFRARVEEEIRDADMTKARIAKRFGVNPTAIETWIRGGRPISRYFHVLARFVRVPVAQMEAWFPERERKAALARGGAR